MSFSGDVAKFAKNAKADVDKKVRGITLDLFSGIILMSPVGNPTLWKVNRRNTAMRDAYVTFATVLNEQGDGKRLGVGKRALDNRFGKIKAPKGYVGGRFRANWNTSVGAPDLTTTHAVDPSGAMAIANARANMGGAGTVTYMANGLPYGQRLEYEGWSKQAPAGFVRVNVARVAEMKVV